MSSHGRPKSLASCKSRAPFFFFFLLFFFLSVSIPTPYYPWMRNQLPSHRTRIEAARVTVSLSPSVSPLFSEFLSAGGQRRPHFKITSTLQPLFRVVPPFLLPPHRFSNPPFLHAHGCNNTTLFTPGRKTGAENIELATPNTD